MHACQKRYVSSRRCTHLYREVWTHMTYFLSLPSSWAGACMKATPFTHRKILTRWLKVNRSQTRCVSQSFIIQFFLSCKLLPWRHRQNSTSEASFEQMVKAAGKELLTGAKAPTLSWGIYYRLVQPVALLIYTDCKKKRGDLQMAAWLTAKVSMFAVRLAPLSGVWWLKSHSVAELWHLLYPKLWHVLNT